MKEQNITYYTIPVMANIITTTLMQQQDHQQRKCSTSELYSTLELVTMVTAK